MRIVFAVLALSSVAVAASAQVPTPPPETAALDYFAGNWRMEGEDQETPFGPGGTVSGNYKCEWFQGRFALVCEGTSEMALGKAKSLGIYTWNRNRKVYSYDGIDSFGMDVSAQARHEGKVWRWVTVPAATEDGISVRYVVTEVTDREYAYEWDYAKGKTAWRPGGKGRAVRH